MTVNPRQSFRAKISLWVILVSTAIFALILLTSLYFSGTQLLNNVEQNIASKRENIALALDAGRQGVETAAFNMIGAMEAGLVPEDTTGIRLVLDGFLTCNPFIKGTVLGFEPGVIKGCPIGFSPYLMRYGEGFVYHDLAKIKDYRSADWYRIPKETKNDWWSRPFRETNGAVISAYNVPIFGNDSTVIGVLAVDMDLASMSDYITGLNPYPNGSISIIDDEGTYVANADKSKILTEKFTHPYLDKILSGETGDVQVGKGKDAVFTVYTPVNGRDWTLVMVIPRTDCTKELTILSKALTMDMVIGILLLFIGSFVVVTKLVKPLEKFAEESRKIAHGHFDVELPVIKDHNELYDLRQALASMGVSLKEYMSRLAESSESKAKMERDLDIARGIQCAMLPNVFPPFPDKKNIDIYASLTPAQAVGGDLYDYVMCGETLFFCIGDVSGKGIPASLIMSITKALFHTSAAEGVTPKQIAEKINNAIAEDNDQMMFITMIIGSCNLKTGETKICNCGHNAPVTNCFRMAESEDDIRTAEEARFVEDLPTNLPIGIMGGFDYEEITIHIREDSKILLYTDGINEAEDIHQNLFGNGRLLDSINSLHKGAGCEETVKKLVADVHRFTDEAPQSDDITCLCLMLKSLSV